MGEKRTDLDFKRTVITYQKREYLWHKRIWTHKNMLVHTSLAQELIEFCLKNNLLTKEDFVDPTYDNPKELLKESDDK